MIGIVNGQYEDFRLWGDGADAARGFQTVQFGHGNVQDGHVGLVLLCQCDRLRTRMRLSTDGPFGTRADQRFEATTHQIVVVSQENFETRHMFSFPHGHSCPLELQESYVPSTVWIVSSKSERGADFTAKAWTPILLRASRTCCDSCIVKTTILTPGLLRRISRAAS